jgi:hypothetical protein
LHLTVATRIPRIWWKKRPKVEKHHQMHTRTKNKRRGIEERVRRTSKENYRGPEEM